MARFAHGWQLTAGPEVPAELIRDFLEPAVRSIPRTMAARLKTCRIAAVPRLEDPDAVSRWRRTAEAAEITVTTEGMEPHDVALELLVCVGQILWEEAAPAEQQAWLEQLRREIEAGVTGEIDEQALECKQRLLATAASARSRRRLLEYARASFAGTAAEYVHCLWHDVTVRTGPEHLPAEWLRRRLELMARWFPPERGRRLFAPA